ncbi:MAG TPA: hypothetical protein VFO85_04580 [Vicinamibacteria bacterium]|nr:hypothetical protein [Vicinamibacteria bacterium]
MKKLILAAATLLLAQGTASAEFAKTLSEANGRLFIEVSGSAGNLDKTAVTISFLARRFDFMTGAAGPSGLFRLSDQKVERGDRIIVELDLPTPNPGSISEATISVTQALGGGTFSRTVNLLDTDDGGVHRFVFDVE